MHYLVSSSDLDSANIILGGLLYRRIVEEYRLTLDRMVTTNALMRELVSVLV